MNTDNDLPPPAHECEQLPLDTNDGIALLSDYCTELEDLLSEALERIRQLEAEIPF